MKHVLEYAVVTGRGEFPFDMLRYDRCFPASEAWANEMGYTEAPRTVIVARWTCQPGNWTRDRWQSFGWVLDYRISTDLYGAEAAAAGVVKRAE